MTDENDFRDQFNQQDTKEEKNIKIKPVYDSHKTRYEVVKKSNEETVPLSEVTEKIATMVVSSVLIALLLGLIFKVKNDTTLESISLYLFIIGAILLFYGSFSTIYSESPTMQVMTKKDIVRDANVKKKDHKFLIYFLSSLIIIFIAGVLGS